MQDGAIVIVNAMELGNPNESTLTQPSKSAVDTKTGGATDHSTRTKEQHVEEVRTTVPEGSLFQGFAVAHKEKHVKHKVEA